jgi:hypothetical protein
MDARRFDGLTRALGRRLDRRRALGLGALALLGGGREATAAACLSKGKSCRSGSCCTGLVCDPTARICRDPRPGESCRVTGDCPAGSTCRSGACVSSVTCRTLKQSCTSAANRRCCAGLSCVSGACLGQEGAACASAKDCVGGLICGHGTCRPSCTGKCGAGLTCTADGDCIELMKICDWAGLPGGTSTVYAACHITRDATAAYVCQNTVRSKKFGVRTGTPCADSAACASWCRTEGYPSCACSLGERISNGAPRENANFASGACVGWTGAFTADTINSCIR